MTPTEPSGLQKSQQAVDAESTPKGDPAGLPGSPSLDEAIQTSLDTIDQELASLEKALQGELSPSVDANIETGPSDEPETASQTPTVQTQDSPAAQDAAPPESPATARTDVSEQARPEPEVSTAVPVLATHTTAPAEPAMVVPSPGSPRVKHKLPRFGRRVLISIITLPIHIVARVLLICDLPFSWVGRSVKNLIGSAGIATCIVAALTWLAGDRLKDWAAAVLPPTAQHTNAPTDPPSGSDSHAH